MEKTLILFDVDGTLTESRKVVKQNMLDTLHILDTLYIMYNNIIIVPYRNREKQLNYFIEKVVPLVKEFLPNTKIIIVEQEQGKDFNRGVLINIGFKLYENKTNRNDYQFSIDLSDRNHDPSCPNDSLYKKQKHDEMRKIFFAVYAFSRRYLFFTKNA